jgi:hypothetical protein
VGADGSHVVVPNSVGPVPGENLATERLTFDLPFHRAEARPLEPELEATDA